MNYITGIRFKISLVNMDLKKKNYEKPTRKIKSEATKVVRCGFTKHFQITSNDFPFGIATIKGRKLALGMNIYQSKAKFTADNSSEEEEGKNLAEEAS